MARKLLPQARSYVYRGFTRLPEPSVRRWQTLAPGRAIIGALQQIIGEGSVMVATGHGAGLLLETGSLKLTNVQAYGLVRGVLEPGVQEALRRHVGEGTVVYDIGANIGFFSLLAARFAGAAGRVESFEPLPGAAAGLRRNIALNDARTVHVHEVAVAASSGRAELLSVDEGGWSHLADRGWHPRTEEVLEVDVVTVDALVADGLAAPDVVKIDVEGSERAVLEGMRETIAHHAPVVICELHATNLELVALMDDLGYSTQNLDGPEPVSEAGPVHVLALPQGSGGTSG